MRPDSAQVKFALRLLVSGALLYLVLRNVDWFEIGQLLAGADVSLLGLVVVLFTLDRFLMAAKWGYLIDITRSRLTFSKRLHLYYVSGVVGLGIPLGALGPDLVRMVIARQDTAGAGRIFVSILVERIHGLAATLAVGGLAFALYLSLAPEGAFGNLPAGAVPIVLAVTLPGAALISATALFPGLYRRAAGLVRWPAGAQKLTGKLVDLSYRLGDRWKVRNLEFLFWTVAEQSFPVLSIWVAAKALGVDMGLVQAIAVVPLNTLVQRLIPISVAGLGFREVTFAFLFSALGITAAEAVGVSLVAFAIFLFSMLPGFLLLLADRKQFETARQGNPLEQRRG